MKARNNSSKVLVDLSFSSSCVGDILDIPPTDYVRQSVEQPKKNISADSSDDNAVNFLKISCSGQH